MKLKYYMRGLGIGIVVTAILMSIFNKGQIQELTDSEIRERAKAIGMIEDTVLADMSEKNLEKLEDEKKESEEDSKEDATAVTPAETQKDVTEGVNDAAEVTSEDAEKDTTEGIKKSTEETPTDTQKDTAEGSKNTVNTANAAAQGAASDSKIPTDSAANTNKTETPLIITVNGGDGSYSVSSKLAEAGLVESASEYDSYLCENGYDKRITSGSHSIPPNATHEEIAKIITKSR